MLNQPPRLRPCLFFHALPPPSYISKRARFFRRSRRSSPLSAKTCVLTFSLGPPHSTRHRSTGTNFSNRSALSCLKTQKKTRRVATRKKSVRVSTSTQVTRNKRVKVSGEEFIVKKHLWPWTRPDINTATQAFVFANSDKSAAKQQETNAAVDSDKEFLFFCLFVEFILGRVSNIQWIFVFVCSVGA